MPDHGLGALINWFLCLLFMVALLFGGYIKNLTSVSAVSWTYSKPNQPNDLLNS
uniref:Uncharacterized protein n=1 Tax=Rhizophora mucronata TaxID=61149 RepID=A0A2P2N9P7_RHIMU